MYEEGRLDLPWHVLSQKVCDFLLKIHKIGYFFVDLGKVKIISGASSNLKISHRLQSSGSSSVRTKMPKFLMLGYLRGIALCSTKIRFFRQFRTSFEQNCG